MLYSIDINNLKLKDIAWSLIGQNKFENINRELALEIEGTVQKLDYLPTLHHVAVGCNSR